MPSQLKVLYVLALAGLLLALGKAVLIDPASGRGPGAVADASVRENPASWRAVYVPYVATSGSSGSGGYGFGK